MPSTRSSHPALALRFAALALAATSVATGLVGHAQGPDVPTAKVLDEVVVAAGAAPAGFDAVVPGHGAEMVGVSYTVAAGDAEPVVEARSAKDGTWGEWLDVSGETDDGPDRGSAEHRDDRHVAAPAWLGHDQDSIEVRVVSGTATDLQLSPIDSEPASTAGGLLGPAPAGAIVAQGPLTSRAQWGARPWGYSIAGCEKGPEYAPQGVVNAFVHHTVSSNTYAAADAPALVRGIQAYHMDSNGWCDIGYNFLVDRYGQVFEGRAGGVGAAVIGAQAGGFNTGSTGIAVIGDFRTAPVPTATYSALVGLLAWKLSFHGAPAIGQVNVTAGDFSGARWPEGTVVPVDRISGHRDVDLTECPGDSLYVLLPQLRVDVQRIIDTAPNDQRLSCDFDGNGKSTPAIFINGAWAYRNSNDSGPPTTFGFGDPGDIPVCGDWLGSGRDGPGVYRDGRLYVRTTATGGIAELSFAFGNPGDRPVVGDWNGDGIDTLAVDRNGTWYVTNSYLPLGTLVTRYGDPGDTPIAGDWDGNGADTIGIARGGTFYLAKSMSSAVADTVVRFGDLSDKPVVGDFDGDGKTTLGVLRGAFWWLSNNLGGNATTIFPF